jgi:hypothetical protein
LFPVLPLGEEEGEEEEVPLLQQTEVAKTVEEMVHFIKQLLLKTVKMVEGAEVEVHLKTSHTVMVDWVEVVEYCSGGNYLFNAKI